MAYIATHATRRGFNGGILDAEAHAIPIAQIVHTINDLAPR
ncbi:MAG: hypothetical protein ACRDP6_26595 [Actinoallomurus sp.]